MHGGYLQAGYFPHGLWRLVPKPLEVAARGAVVDPNAQRPADRRSELGCAVNWFFDGHDNKLTVDLFRYQLARPNKALSDTRVRLQWEITI